LSSAIIWFGFGVDLSVVVGVVDIVVVVRCGLSKTWLLSKLVLIEEFDEGLDRLLLGEDAVGLDWVACLVPPSTFFWTPVVESRLVDGDCCWVLMLPLLVDLISLDCKSCFPRAGVGLAEFSDVRHLSASTRISMMIDAMTIRWTMMSSSRCLGLVIVKLPFLLIGFTHGLLLLVGKVSHCVEEISVALLVNEVRVSHGLS